jgi:hypothetical protein
MIPQANAARIDVDVTGWVPEIEVVTFVGERAVLWRWTEAGEQMTILKVGGAAVSRLVLLYPDRFASRGGQLQRPQLTLHITENPRPSRRKPPRLRLVS